MQSTISLRAPNIGPAPELAVGFVDSVCSLVELGENDADALRRATDGLVRFALQHAYPEGAEGEIAVEAHVFDGGIRIDVHDWGLPLELERHRTAQGSHDASAFEAPGLGLEHLVDEVTFHNLGRDGKLFSIVKHCEHSSPVAAATPLLSEHDDHEQTPGRQPPEVTVRRFEPGDEEAICQLVYRNYSNTYGADFFYVPEKLLERNRNGEVASTVALVEGQIVGHLALLREDGGPTAESGAAVVHPDYKGIGIFNAMVVPALDEARELGLDAVYGQAVTVHPYSQKAAFSHGYRDTGVAVGRARASIRLEGNKLTRTGKRHAIVLHYLVFDPQPRAVSLPALYRDEIVRAYENVGVPVEEERGTGGRRGPSAELNAGLNIGTIAIDRWADGDDIGFGRAFHYLLAKHCDMIYAEIDLRTVADVDAVVDRLNREGFFYSGVVLYGRDGHDQLRLQYENTLDVDEDEIICYSDFAQELRRFVLEDKARVVPDAGTG